MTIFKLSFSVCRYDHLLSLADALNYLNLINNVGTLMSSYFNAINICISFIITSRNPSNPKALKTGTVSRLLGAGSISCLKVSMKIIITYLIRVFDTTWESKFWALKFLFLDQFFILSC